LLPPPRFGGGKHVKVYQKSSPSRLIFFVTSKLKSRWCLRRFSFWTTWGHEMWYSNFFLSFKSYINLFQNLFSIYFAKFANFVMLWENISKVGQKKFHSYVAFWKGLGHDLMNWAHAMHFSIMKKYVLDAKSKFMKNLLLKGFTMS
jgi:hypothetical protein